VTGRSGAAGERGTAGPAGEKGRAGVVDRWTSYREIWFVADKAELDDAQAAKVSEIATYLKENPSLQVGIDTTADTRESNRQHNQRIADDRLAVISDALIEAGVPASRIKSGSFDDPALRRDRRVAVLISTSNERAQADR
jgi:outer membrane protein OmpA-like peptidoglycan-associated protein